jgi:hypothetical protein
MVNMAAVPIKGGSVGISTTNQESVPLPSKLLARLHEVTHVFSSESHRKAVILALRERKVQGASLLCHMVHSHQHGDSLCVDICAPSSRRVLRHGLEHRWKFRTV